MMENCGFTSKSLKFFRNSRSDVLWEILIRVDSNSLIEFKVSLLWMDSSYFKKYIHKF